jgi:2-C-methyl-D-erythritol 4-phosphate cytidylyltransferase
MIALKKYAIIVAGGTGSRMAATTPKQFIKLNEKPVLMHSISRFFVFDASIHILLVLPENQITIWQQLCTQYNFDVPHTIIKGGSERFFSVQNALQTITDNEGVVAIHDGVRPLVSKHTIALAYESAALKGTGIPCVNLNDSIRKVEQGKNIAQNRADFKLIQTPQCFKVALIKKAFEQSYQPLFTDDAAVAEYGGATIHLTQGNVENIKITTPFDLQLAALLSNQEQVH